MKNNNGVSLILLGIILTIIVFFAGISIYHAIGDDGVISKTIKMDIDTTKEEVQSTFKLLIDEETKAASADLVGTNKDLTTRFNEPALIYYLKGNPNYIGKEYEEKNCKACIEEFDSKNDGKEENNIYVLNPKYKPEDESSPAYGIALKSKYRVIPEKVCSNGDKYGLGKNIKDGDIFTFEAVGIDENGNSEQYDGKFELVYYDNNNNRYVLDTYSLYLTNQS